MLQTYKGHFREGRFVSLQNPPIPEYVEVFVVVTDKTVSVEQAFEESAQIADSRKSNLALPPTLDTRGWKFDREDANAR